MTDCGNWCGDKNIIVATICFCYWSQWNKDSILVANPEKQQQKLIFQNGDVEKGSAINELEIEQILPSVFDGIDFPGYDKVRLSYSNFLQ